MGTTNILDLNNRLTKVEKGNVAQNSYTSLKIKPKINGVTLTGNKSLADIGAAAAADVGDKTQLTTTDKSSAVAAINELNSGLNNVSKGKFINPHLESGGGNIYWSSYSDAYSNLDNIDVSGFGAVKNTDTNFPSDIDGWGSLVSFCDGDIRSQFYYNWNNGKLYFRSLLNNTWTAWKNITMT